MRFMRNSVTDGDLPHSVRPTSAVVSVEDRYATRVAFEKEI